MQSLLIGKPRKHDKSTYSSNIYWESKNKFLTFDLKNVRLCSLKRSDDDVYLFIKSKQHNNVFADLNATVIDIVKANCAKWFSQALSPDLIEDYYSNTLVYDKKLGNLIRIKCMSVNVDDITDTPLSCDIKVTLKTLRFFKQKFVLEWDLDELEMLEGPSKGLQGTLVGIDDSDGEEDDGDEEEEIPMPDDEDIGDIRRHMVERCVGRLEEVTELLERLNKEHKDLTEAMNRVKSEEDYNEFIKACHEAEELFLNHA